MSVGIGHIIYITQRKSYYFRAKVSHSLLQSFSIVLNEAKIQDLVLVGASLERTAQKGQSKRKDWVR
jgi:hypothetical protein